MFTELDSPATDRESLSTMSVQTRRQLCISFADITILAGLTLVALLPRIILALQLDMVTDEVVYIEAAKIYFQLLERLKIGTSGWSINYEHPPLVKLLIGLSLSLNTLFVHSFSELLAARFPSIIMGTLLVLAIYWLGRASLGRVIALLAALCLAFSPWLVYFSGLAYLDMTMTAFISIAYLLLWYAPQRPALYLLSAVLVGLGAASKYTAVLVIPGMVLFTAYFFFLIRPRLPVELRLRIPWGWWIMAVILAPLTFLAADPAIWPSPYSLLLHSFSFEWDHSVKGHLTFIAGQPYMHAPHWAIFSILLTKMSLFVTLSATFFACYALVQLVRFHLHAPSIQTSDVISLSFLLIWLIAIIGMFSLLTIVVGTHYELPAAPPVALAGAYGLTMLLRYRRGRLFSSSSLETTPKEVVLSVFVLPSYQSKLNPRGFATVFLLTIVLAGPHLIGLVSIPDAEGYSSELFHGENTTLQIAYPGYRDALQWLEAHSHGHATVGLVTTWTMAMDTHSTSWYYYNERFSARYHIIAIHPGEHIPVCDYLIFPMDVIQRGMMTIPAPWKYHIIHAVRGGDTTYCYITARTSPDLIAKGQTM